MRGSPSPCDGVAGRRTRSTAKKRVPLSSGHPALAGRRFRCRRGCGESPRKSALGPNSAVGSCQMNDRSYLGSRHAIPITPCRNRARSSHPIIGIRAAEIDPFPGFECAIRTPDLEQTFASPFRAPVNRRSREPAPVTLSGRVAPRNTSARSRACWMVGFVIPMPEGIGRGANSAVARLRRSWPTRGGAVWESGERREAGVP
jgi:hypothetical protein